MINKTLSEKYERILSDSKRRSYDIPREMQKSARIKLFQRIKSGENPYDILKINRKETYFMDKILRGLIQIDDLLYYRITGIFPYRTDSLLSSIIDEFVIPKDLDEIGEVNNIDT